jgi:hypothetical protein
LRLSLISAAAFRASVVVPYIRLRAITGRFFQKLLFSENLALASVARALFGKGTADTVGLTDIPDVVSNKPFTNGVGATEQFDLFQLAKGLTESLTLEVQGSYFAEDYTFGGYTVAGFSIEVRKSAAEVVGVTDLFGIIRSKQPSEAVGLTETVVRGAISSIIDTPTVSDSGALQMQDYCALDYFAQDYVGRSQAF